jgi:hypothetical protein
MRQTIRFHGQKLHHCFTCQRFCEADAVLGGDATADVAIDTKVELIAFVGHAALNGIWRYKSNTRLCGQCTWGQ